MDAINTGRLPSYDGQIENIDNLDFNEEEEDGKEEDGKERKKKLRILDGNEMILEHDKRQISLQELIKEKRLKEYQLNKLGNPKESNTGAPSSSKKKKNKKKASKKSKKREAGDEINNEL